MTYEYVCTTCNHMWEATQSIRDEALKDCPSCGKATARRQVSGGTGFVLKGGGWYNDLYSSTRPASADSPAASSDSTSTESKPAETKAAEAKPVETKVAETKSSETKAS